MTIVYDAFELAKRIITALIQRTEKKYEKEWPELNDVPPAGQERLRDAYLRFRNLSKQVDPAVKGSSVGSFGEICQIIWDKFHTSLASPLSVEASEATLAVDLYCMLQSLRERYEGLHGACLIMEEVIETVKASKKMDIYGCAHPEGVTNAVYRLVSQKLGQKTPSRKRVTVRTLMDTLPENLDEDFDPAIVSHKQKLALTIAGGTMADVADPEKYASMLNRMNRVDIESHVKSMFQGRAFEGLDTSEEFVKGWIQDHMCVTVRAQSRAQKPQQ